MQNVNYFQDSQTLTLSLSVRIIRKHFIVGIILIVAFLSCGQFNILPSEFCQLVAFFGIGIPFVFGLILPFLLEGKTILTKEQNKIIFQKKIFNNVISTKNISEEKVLIKIVSDGPGYRSFMPVGYAVKLNFNKKDNIVFTSVLSTDDAIELCHLLKDFIGDNAEIVKKLNWV